MDLAKCGCPTDGEFIYHRVCRAKLDREKLGRVLYINERLIAVPNPKTSFSEAWDKFTPRLKKPYLQDADAIIKYFEEG